MSDLLLEFLKEVTCLLEPVSIIYACLVVAFAGILLIF